MTNAAVPESLAVQRLARVLRVAPDRLSYLAETPDADVDAFRRQISRRMLDITAPGSARVAMAAQVVPPRIAAKVVTRNDTPAMTAHLAAVRDSSRATAVAQRLPVAYLARVAALLDLDETADVIRGLPIELTVSVTEELAVQQDWVTMAGMLEILEHDALERCLAALDAERILAITRLLGRSVRDRVAASLGQPLAGRVRAIET